jgi:DNA-binding response OmpR family regulator
MKILIIEDDKDTTTLIEASFKKFYKNAELTIVHSGVDAYKILYSTNRDNQFDYIIIDMRLPDENGAEIIKLIKIFFSSKIIVYTAYKDYKDRCKYHYFFEKGSTTVEELINMILEDSKI